MIVAKIISLCPLSVEKLLKIPVAIRSKIVKKVKSPFHSSSILRAG